jgi:V/A-type H+/Na+-transporting ATPase subunit D
MAILKVNPTRMELIKLKRKLTTAKRGHKLLKEKRDGLMKEFMAIIRQAKALREEIEEKMGGGFKAFAFTSAEMGRDEVFEALFVPTRETSLLAKTKNVMSVNVPVFKYHEDGRFDAYSLGTTSGQLDTALKIFSESLKSMVELAEKEHSAKLMAAEIEKTRRRVNALEYVFIPNMKETLKYITAKLNEQERSSIITVMKIKQEMDKQAALEGVK